MSMWKWLGAACALFATAPCWSTPYALGLLALNAELHPQNGNLQDSLADAYEQTGRRDSVRRHYQQALTLGARAQDCYWCANAQAALDRLDQAAASE